MNNSFKSLRRLIWLYFWLLLLEGALRKWLMPGLSNALLIVRDPVAFAIYALAFRERVFPRSAFVHWIAALAALCFAASFAGIGNLPVTLYGLRADFLHLPLILLMPRVLRAQDVRRMGFALLLLLPPMALLAVKQFEAGPGSPWNVGVGGEIGGQLYAAEGKVRASGTFSFATGLSTYLALCTAVLLYDTLRTRHYPRWLVLTAAPALILTLVISGSRTAVISVGIVCTIFLFVGLQRPTNFRVALWIISLVIGVVTALALLTPLFREGVAVHRERFEGGGGLQKGIIERFGEDFVAAGNALNTSPILGLGLGVGTNVGANLLRGRREFVLGEGEWQRVILESGPVLGCCYILTRLALLLAVLKASATACGASQPLALLLASAGGLELATGQFGQPTTLGFAVFIAGLALTASREVREEPPRPLATEPARFPLRGRSAYADRLHGGPQTGGAL